MRFWYSIIFLLAIDIAGVHAMSEACIHPYQLPQTEYYESRFLYDTPSNTLKLNNLSYDLHDLPALGLNQIKASIDNGKYLISVKRLNLIYIDCAKVYKILEQLNPQLHKSYLRVH